MNIQTLGKHTQTHTNTHTNTHTHKHITTNYTHTHKEKKQLKHNPPQKKPHKLEQLQLQHTTTLTTPPLHQSTKYIV